MASVGTLWSITLDCSDPLPLGRFWADLLGGDVVHESRDFVGVTLPTGLWIGAYRVDDYCAPSWSGEASTKQFHLDVTVSDLDAAQQAAVELGATVAEYQPEPDRWRVLLDPAGHPFCVTNQAA